VTGVQNDIYLDVATPYASDVKHSIKKAFARNAKLDAKNIDVQTVDGTAILTGRMSSWAGHDTAVAAAWADPGVTALNDRISILYRALDQPSSSSHQHGWSVEPSVSSPLCPPSDLTRSGRHRRIGRSQSRQDCSVSRPPAAGAAVAVCVLRLPVPSRGHHGGGALRPIRHPLWTADRCCSNASRVSGKRRPATAVRQWLSGQ